jgi:two-component system sensor histidine kinase KdpD
VTDERPSPDALLASMDDAPTGGRRRGRLKIFFGAAPGVGKTYAMLEQARQRAMEGEDVLVGYAEPHIRPDTESLLIGLEVLPHRLVDHRGTVVHEFDLDGAIARNPSLVCVDELAHHNAPGQRHEKRWQDVFELLERGIDVYTTLNVQHLESVKDVVERITGVVVRETIPDRVVDRADEIELIDTTPDELTQRLRDGKVYAPEVAGRALRHFFTRANLTALRELALRRTAERVDAQMREARAGARVRTTWAASERVLVCIGPGPFSARLIRAARRLAAGMRAPWMAVFVETPRTAALPRAARAQVDAHLRLAEQLGGEAVVVSGHDVAPALVAYARDRNVTRIVLGKPHRAHWRERLLGSIGERIIRLSGDMDVHLIQGVEEGEARGAPPAEHPRARVDWPGIAAAVAVTAATTALCLLLHRRLGLSEVNVLMLYLLGVLAVSMRWSRVASGTAAALAVLAFDVLFIEPIGSITVTDREYLLTFVIMLATGLLIGTLVHRLRAQAVLFRERQRSTQALQDLATEVGRLADANAICRCAAERIGSLCRCDASVLLPDAAGALHVHGSHGAALATGGAHDKERAVAQWAFEHNAPAGRGTGTLPAAAGLYLPLRGAGAAPVGVLGLRIADDVGLRAPDQRRLIESLAAQAAVAIERASLAVRNQEAWEQVERENVRNTLLSAVSHDLRTPLAAITGSASALASPRLALDAPERRELAESILAESARMERVVANLLEMSRIQAGGVQAHPEPGDLGELARGVVQRLGGVLGARRVAVTVHPDAPRALMDATLADQIVTNLVENAIHHTPADTPIDIIVRGQDDQVLCEVADRGPGVPEGQSEAVFERFRQLHAVPERRGLGLGLAIARALAAAQGGRVSVSARDGGGAVFRVALPAWRAPRG